MIPGDRASGPHLDQAADSLGQTGGRAAAARGKQIFRERVNHPDRILTIGHSTLAADGFVAMLTAHRIELLADVQGIARLLKAARSRTTAIMCAEKSWRVCHRGLIADHLKASGIEVIHILDATSIEPHPWTAAARMIDGRLSYAAARIDQQQLPF
jgi:uncharacterized protein (DUF488 family)